MDKIGCNIGENVKNKFFRQKYVTIEKKMDFIKIYLGSFIFIHGIVDIIFLFNFFKSCIS